MTELIKITQLPVIEDQLRAAKDKVETRVKFACSIVSTEETLQTVKDMRAELRKEFAALEEQRKAVKTAVMAPYLQLEEVYKECVSDLYKRADADLAGKIGQIEGEIKGRCEAKLRAYFEEACEAARIDFVTFEQTGVKVDMTSAKQKTPKKLYEQINNFIIAVENGMSLIATMDHADEIMVEYKRSLNAAEAIGIVQDRHRRLEAEKEAKAAREAAKAQEAEAVKRVMNYAPPVEQKKPETLRLTFTVTDTRDRLKLLKQFLDTNHYKYE